MKLQNSFFNFGETDGYDCQDRRRTPRYATNFLTQNTIISTKKDSIVYDGLSTIENISSQGMCVKMKIPTTVTRTRYKTDRKFFFSITLFFSGKKLNFEARVAWTEQTDDQHISRVGWDFTESLKNREDLLTYFEEEKFSQEQFYLSVL